MRCQTCAGKVRETADGWEHLSQEHLSRGEAHDPLVVVLVEMVFDDPRTIVKQFTAEELATLFARFCGWAPAGAEAALRHVYAMRRSADGAQREAGRQR